MSTTLNATDNKWKWQRFSCVAVGTFVAFLDSSIVNISLPTLSRKFGSGMSVIEWVVTSYLLMITGLVVVFGRLADIYGRKRLYVGGFVVFTVGSALCGASPSIEMLIVFRCIQGIGAAALLANGLAIVSETFPSNERGRAIGIISSVLALASIAGPLLGGILTDHVGWRSIFYVNLPIGVVGCFLAVRFLATADNSNELEPFDIAGAVVLMICLSSFLLLLNSLSQTQHRALIYAPLGAGFVSLAIWFRSIETGKTAPLVDLGLFSSRAFNVPVVSSFLSFWALASLTFLMPFYMDNVLGFSPSKTGSILAPVPVMLVLVAPLGGYLGDKIGVRAVSVAGAAVNCLGFLGLSTLGPSTSPLGILLRLTPLGIGMGLFQPANNTAIMGAVPPGRLGIASGITSAIKNLGSMSGVAVTSLGFNLVNSMMLGRSDGSSTAAGRQQAYVTGIRAMYIVSAILFSFAVLTSLVQRGTEIGTGRGEVAAAQS